MAQLVEVRQGVYRLVKPACQPAEYDEIVLLDGTGQAQIDVWMRRSIVEREDHYVKAKAALPLCPRRAPSLLRLRRTS